MRYSRNPSPRSFPCSPRWATFRYWLGAIFLGVVVLFLMSGNGSLRAATIQDDQGTSVSLTKPPQRIIPLYGGLTEILVGLGLADRVVATTQGDGTIEGIPTVGTHLQPNVEMILALKPDLVLQGGVSKAMPALRKLEGEGLPVAMFAPHDFPTLFSTIDRVGRLTGREQAAEALEGAMQAQLAEVARRIKGQKRPRVFFEVRYENLLAAGQGSLVNDIIVQAGGVNVVENRRSLAPFSLEALVQVDPDVYIIQKGPMNRSPEDIYTRPYFQELRAVKNRRVLVVDEKLYSRPGPRSAQAVEELARFLHPEVWEKK